MRRNRQANIPQHTLDLLNKFGLDPKKQDILWDCHGTWIIYSRWVEEIGHVAGVTLEMPEVIHSDVPKKEAVILVRGTMGERSAWSFGEATPANNKNAYFFAMAEKRAKDRVILKLVGLAGHVYTDQDVADIKDGKPVWSISEKAEQKDTANAVDDLRARIESAEDVDGLMVVADAIKAALDSGAISSVHRQSLQMLWQGQKAVLTSDSKELDDAYKQAMEKGD
jgi:hypothetical protein